ncbi:hypothetical protein ROZALSC1DRAFT_30373 [Rozella allomycis CSF55]|uniref:Uncharacterized protein n=1 Tax=Rozella allomycis (strain CSF55) TaxID=988480 RepID=A0A4V1IZF4_ROZAC|nr:hypothetical protein ROZALSC1DRAFT_30373 [Rozella allomycis CSF55]
MVLQMNDGTLSREKPKKSNYVILLKKDENHYLAECDWRDGKLSVQKMKQLSPLTMKVYYALTGNRVNTTSAGTLKKVSRSNQSSASSCSKSYTSSSDGLKSLSFEKNEVETQSRRMPSKSTSVSSTILNHAPSTSSFLPKVESVSFITAPSVSGCKCGGYFCPSHRFNDQHLCTYDFKKEGREKIAKENPLIRNHRLL